MEKTSYAPQMYRGSDIHRNGKHTTKLPFLRISFSLEGSVPKISERLCVVTERSGIDERVS